MVDRANLKLHLKYRRALGKVCRCVKFLNFECHVYRTLSDCTIQLSTSNCKTEQLPLNTDKANFEDDFYTNLLNL